MSKYAKYANYVGPRAAADAAASRNTAGDGQQNTSGQLNQEPVERQQDDGQQQREDCGDRKPWATDSCIFGSPIKQSDTKRLLQQQRQTAEAAAPGESSLERPSSELSRTTLLGRPLKVETHHRDHRHRKKQNTMYNFLERPRGWRAVLYHMTM